MIGKADTWETFIERMIERAAEGKPSESAMILYGGRWARIMDMIKAGKNNREIMACVPGLDSNTLSVYRKAAAGKLCKKFVDEPEPGSMTECGYQGCGLSDSKKLNKQEGL